MSLVTNRKEALYGGVNQQAPRHRLSYQVEEMINCTPSVDRGVMKRNPTENIRLFDIYGARTTIDFSPDMWTYEYDRDRGTTNKTQISYMVTPNGITVIDINSGIVYREGAGLVFANDDAKQYFTVFGGRDGFSATTIKDSVFIANKYVLPRMVRAEGHDDYKDYGYIWVKRVDVVDGYSYGCIIDLAGPFGNAGDTLVVPNGTPQTSSDAAASDLASRIMAANSNLTAIASGSVIQVRNSLGQIAGISATDTFGDLASFGWGHKVDSSSDLPSSTNEFNALVKIGTNDKASYWMANEDDKWVESFDTMVDQIVQAPSMPHTISKRFNSTDNHVEFFVDQYEWTNRVIGDSETNGDPRFLDLDHRQTIKEILFLKDRMAIITADGLSLSEVGVYGNFFRTSVATLLDSDRIDIGIQSQSPIRIEHALVYDDSIIMFSDVSQFQFSSGVVLSPSSFKISEISSYEVNIKIKPLLMNDKIFFVSMRGDYSALMELTIANQSTRSSEAVDLSAQCQMYIDGDVDRLTGSPINNMLFLGSRDDRETVFVYKYMGANKEIQSAWFKWKFNGSIYASFALGEQFLVFIDRIAAFEEVDWILGSGRWEMNREWKMDAPWIMNPSALRNINQLERMDIFPHDQSEIFLDNKLTPIESFVNFGEWVYGTDGNRDTRGTLKMKTVEIDSEDGSIYDLWIKDKNRDTTRIVPHKIIDGRKPMVYGDSKNINVGFVSSYINGFRISAVSFEGNLNRRATSR